MPNRLDQITADLSVLQKHLKAVDFGYSQLKAVKGEVSDSAAEPPTFELEVSIPPFKESTESELSAKIGLAANVVLSDGEIAVSAYGRYQIHRDFQSSLNHESLTAYANLHAVDRLLGYLREGISDLSARVFRVPLLMPIPEELDLRFDLPPSEELGRLRMDVSEDQ